MGVSSRVNIEGGLQKKWFLTALTKCQGLIHILDDTEERFVNQMADMYATRADSISLGLQPWQPTIKQFNWLREIANGKLASFNSRDIDMVQGKDDGESVKHKT